VSPALDVPVLLVLFARPDKLRPVFERIRAARPRTLLVATDGPRPDHPEDADACRASRAVVDVDWPCEVLRTDAPENLGCDRRLTSALDWAFDHVERVIVIEDDIVAEPDFFGFASTMLERYEDDPVVMHVTGRNELGRWGSPAQDHLRVLRGSVWGWATWARAWHTRGSVLGRLDDPDLDVRLAEHAADPIVAEHLALHLATARDGTLGAWDVTWSLARALVGGLCVAPTVNLVRNVGFGPTATRTTHHGDLRGGLPSLRCAAPAAGNAPDGPPRRDPRYDRWGILVDLMSTYRDPAAARRLARAGDLLARARPDGRAARHHLTPFTVPCESLAVLEHVRAAGSSSGALDALTVELRRACDEQGADR
jgi:hypothetical protein